MELSTTPVTTITTLKDAIAALVLLQASVEVLTKTVSDLTAPRSTNVVEMTDDHARRIMVGDLADKKHNDAAKALGLSYGQIYSCRGQYTFKHIHKELANREGGFKNPWVKA